jgi:hypothetical protein
MLLGAFAAQAASAAESGQTIFECAKNSTKTFTDAHCDHAGTGEYGHKKIKLGTKVTLALTNSGTEEETKKAALATLKIAKLHGFSNVVIECTEVSGTGEAENSISGEVMKGSGKGVINFHSGGGGNCTTNQTGCTVKVAEVNAKAESIQPSATEMGLKFEPATAGTNFTTTTFEGTCGLHEFGAIPVKGSTIGTANGIPNGGGATVWFIENHTGETAMNALTVGGEAAQLIGKGTFKNQTTGNALVFTTPPFTGTE